MQLYLRNVCICVCGL